MQLDDDLVLSTLAMEADWRPRRYLSAEHAVGQYVRLRSLMGGSRALDYEQIGLRVQTSPAPENPALDAVDDIQLLERAFSASRRRVTSEEWKVWCGVRIRRRGLRSFPGMGKATAGRRRDKVDGVVEEELKRGGLLVRSEVRLDAERYLA